MNQVPGSTTYSLALYYMMNTSMEDTPLLESFIKVIMPLEIQDLNLYHTYLRLVKVITATICF